MFARAGIEISPLKLDNAIFGLTAGAGRAVLKATDPILRSADAPERPTPTMADIPGLRAFALRYPSGSAQSIQGVYDRFETLEQKRVALQYARKTPGVEADQLSGEEWRELRTLKSARKKMQRLTTAARNIESSRELSASEKRTRLDDIAERRLDLAQRALAIVSGEQRERGVNIWNNEGDRMRLMLRKLFVGLALIAMSVAVVAMTLPAGPAVEIAPDAIEAAEVKVIGPEGTECGPAWAIVGERVPGYMVTYEAAGVHIPRFFTDEQLRQSFSHAGAVVRVHWEEAQRQLPRVERIRCRFSPLDVLGSVAD